MPGHFCFGPMAGYDEAAMDVEPTTLSDVIRLISEVLHQH